MKCHIENNFWTKEELIAKSIEIYGDKYDYSKVEYKNSKTPVIIICKKHGEFNKKMCLHLNGEECYSCFMTEKYIRKAIETHGNRYDYSQVDFADSGIKIKIRCKKHGYFCQYASSHIGGRNCPKCAAEESTYTTEEWIRIVKAKLKQTYDYSKTKYINSETKLEIICILHGSFWQLPNVHYNEHSCPSCKNKTEGFLLSWLNKYFDIVRQAKFDWCRSPITNHYFPFDFYIKELNCIIELDGRQHFEQVAQWDFPEYTQKKDALKMQQAIKQKISVIRLLQEDVAKNNEKWLETKLLPLLVKSKNPKIHYIIAEEKNKNIYDKHKELYNSIVNFGTDINNTDKLNSEELDIEELDVDDLDLDEMNIDDLEKYLMPNENLDTVDEKVIDVSSKKIKQKNKKITTFNSKKEKSKKEESLDESSDEEKISTKKNHISKN